MPIFDSQNPLQSLELVVNDSAQGLLAELRKIPDPIEIIAIHQMGYKSAAYFIRTVKKPKALKKTKLNILGDDDHGSAS